MKKRGCRQNPEAVTAFVRKTGRFQVVFLVNSILYALHDPEKPFLAISTSHFDTLLAFWDYDLCL